VHIGKCRNFSPTLLAEVDDIHVCIWGSRETLVSLCYLKWRMTLLKYGSPLYFTKSSVERKKGTPHVLHRRANLRPRRKAQACGTSMNGLPKFDSWPCGSATSFWSFSFWLPLSLQIGNLVGLYHDCDNMRSCKISLYKQPIHHHHLKHVYLSYGFASFRYCAIVVASPSRVPVPACTGNWECRSQELLVVSRSYIGRRRIRFFKAPSHFSRPSWWLVIHPSQRCHVPSSLPPKRHISETETMPTII
jgi:hypothetical protein